MKETNNNWICIDFDTCNTAAAIIIDNTPHFVTYGNSLSFPTIACVLDDGPIEVCQNAEQFRKTNPETFKQEFKLSIGDDIDINSVSYTDIVTAILTFVKGCAELENNGKNIENVLLTVPAIYTEADVRKNIMLVAAKKAGFRVIEFISEAEAAAYHYMNILDISSSGISIIYDLRGGTLEPVILDMTKLKQPKIIGFDTGVKCGGHFFDKEIYNNIYKKTMYKNTPLSKQSKLDDYLACRRLKEALSIQTSSTQLFSNGEKITFTRIDFENLISPKIELTLNICDNLINTAKLKWNNINQVLLVGGSTSIPLISESIKKHLLSHNAGDINIIRNVKGINGEYNHLYATCLGGVAKKIMPIPTPKEKIASLIYNGEKLQLKMGENSFGRGIDMNFRFQDPWMSTYHFSINVTMNSDNKFNYILTTKSSSKSTIINGIEALDLSSAPISRVSTILLDGYIILAGKTT